MRNEDKANLNGIRTPDYFYENRISTGMNDPFGRAGSDLHHYPKDCQIETHFENLESLLCAEIRKYPVVVGCMAWLTNEKVLAALSEKQEVSMIVQKEDFLRPDSQGWSSRKQRTRYDALPSMNMDSLFIDWGHDNPGFANLSNMKPMYLTNEQGAFTIDSVRCMGVAPERNKTTPKMHHKFMVFCEWKDHTPMGVEYKQGITHHPVGIWTGSFNATQNGANSIENAVIIRHYHVANHFYLEWARLLHLSEPLDWTHPYVAPEYHLETGS